MELGIEHRVILKTNVDDETLCYLYNQALAFVYPSLYEGFGIPLLEAMKSGCLILASDIPTTREVSGDIPIYFDPVDVGDIVRTLNQLISQDHQDQRVQAGIARAEKYSWDDSARETLNVYRELVGRG
jgi:glycosyltransferase involved in cell wall biosynthesis